MRCALFMLASLLGSLLSIQPADAQQHPPADCPVTKPPDPPFVPPPPWRTEEGRFWLGTNALWTSLSDDGIWGGVVVSGRLRQKFWWWREGWTPETDRGANGPGLSVTARRLDRAAPPVGAEQITNGNWGTGWVMLAMLELPSEGCWELTGNYRSNVVSMVVYVPPFEGQ